MADQPADKWRIETNDRYNKIVSSVISLATGALVLPAVFLRQFLGIPAEKALAQFLTGAVYTSWGLLGCSVIFGLTYSWVSIKWVKVALGEKVLIPEHFLECVLDMLFGLMALCFLGGIGAGVWFFWTVRVTS